MERTALYCGRCLRFLAYSERWLGDVIEWGPPCDWCRRKLAEAKAEVERLEEMWSVRECAALDCQVTFAPATSTQRFCSDRCRKRTHWRSKAAASAA